MLRIAVFTLLTLGCSDLATVERLRCGNGLHEIEANEDCDGLPAGSPYACGSPGSAGACRLLCDAAPCPGGWSCGGDGICRVGMGQLEPVSSVLMRGFNLATGDLDADGYDDVISQSFASLHVAYGSADGTLSAPVGRGQPTAQTPHAVGDVDGDGYADVVTSTTDGVHIFRGRPARRLVPVITPQGTPEGAPVFAAGVRMIPPFTEESLLSAWATDDGIRLEIEGRPITLEARDALDLAEVQQIFTVAPREVGEPDWIALETTAGQVVIVAFACQASGACALDRVASLAAPGGRVAQVRMGDVDGDGRLDLVGTFERASNRQLAISFQGADGFGPLAIEPAFDRTLENLRPEPGNLHIEAVVDLVGDGRAELVISDRLLIWDGERVRVSPLGERPYERVLLGDVNGDGRTDIIGAHQTTLQLITADHADQLVTKTLATRNDGLAVGDFDADGRDDIVIIDATQRGVFGLFGARELRDSSLEQIAILEDESAMLATTRRRGDDLFLRPSILHVLREGAWYALVGSPVELPTSRLFADTAGVGRDITIGRFFEGERGVIMRKQALQAATTVMLPGSLVGREPPQRIEDPCAAQSLQWALTQAVDFDGDGIDALLTLTSGATGGGPMQGAPDGEGPPTGGPPGEGMGGPGGIASPTQWAIHRADIVGNDAICRWTSSIPAGLAPVDLEIVDLNGDGRDDIVALLIVRNASPNTPRDPGEAGLAIWLANDRAHDPAILTPLPNGVVSIATLRLSAGKEILLLAHAGALRQAEWRDDELQLTDLTSLPAATQGLARGDVNGDGLDDLVVGTGESIAVYRQLPCTARAVFEGRCTRPAP